MPQTHFETTLKAENDFAVTGYPLKQRFLDLAHVAFCASHKAENQFVGTDDPFEQRFLDFDQISFLLAQKARNEFLGPGDGFSTSRKSIFFQPQS
jgi:hypothetical protein